MLLNLNDKQKQVVRLLTKNFKSIEQLQKETSLPKGVLGSILAFLVEAKYAETLNI